MVMLISMGLQYILMNMKYSENIVLDPISL